MGTLQNILDINQFNSLMREGKKSPHASYSWWDDCIYSVKLSIFQDKTTTRDNLRDKAISYAQNYLALCPEASFIQDNSLMEEIADKIEDDLKDVTFDQRPPAYVAAQISRNTIPEQPENRFIRLR